jgi:predicted Zn-dependent protease
MQMTTKPNPAITLQRLAETYAAKGDSAQAHDAYMESLAMAVGSAAGHAKYNASLAAGTRVHVEPYDPNSDPRVAAYPLSAADRIAAINDGLRRAANWRKQS